ncbi:hypothetical protein JKP88DRAFT_248901 [Tribonema minus]|uniref:NB-ARC domain-containing protein n=1 Tax=Tribonema minus TaxID=303371 RepID=A0A835YKV2_9STRA|nr:hypothetical protein JKP88DRAFT_248901 [Tribonema minus]
MTEAAIRSAWLKELKLWQENDTPGEHKTKLDNWLESAPAKLVVLDNIWKQTQLERLFTHSVTAGSLVIITARGTDIQIGLSPHRAQLFPMPGLKPDDATAMFRHCSDTPVPPYPALETKIVRACAGMPLALEVAASRLRVQRDLQGWQDTLTVLETGHTPGDKLQDMIDQSVDDLRRDSALAYNMFLDAATVMHGRSQQHAMQVWPAMYSKEERVVRLSWAALTKRSLVKADDEGNLRVHDVIKALAGSKAEDDGTRVWQPHQVSVRTATGVADV